MIKAPDKDEIQVGTRLPPTPCSSWKAGTGNPATGVDEWSTGSLQAFGWSATWRLNGHAFLPRGSVHRNRPWGGWDPLPGTCFPPLADGGLEWGMMPRLD